MNADDASDVPELEVAADDGAVVAFLGDLQRAVLLHPEAAAALFAAFVREGRSFAQTTEGRRLQQRILRSRLLERAELVWHAATQWIPEQGQGGSTPSALVNAVAAVARSGERDRLLEKLFLETQGGE